MRENQALVALFFYDSVVGHTHIVVDAESHIADGGNEESAIDWAYEHFGKGREVFGVEFGNESHVKSRTQLVHSHSVEVSAY